MEQLTFESILEVVRAILPPEANEERSVRWVAKKELGVARDSTGAFELFLPGIQVSPASPLIAQHLHFDEWQDANTATFHANRLVLPSEPHFVPVAAFLVEELLRNGLLQDGLKIAFGRSEPLIEMALRRIALSEQTLVGLIGELRLLHLLLTTASTPNFRGQVVEAWRGYERATYDFVFGAAVAEVKTTIGSVSRHEIQGVRQVDAPRAADGQPLIQLYLLSVGIGRATGSEEVGTTLCLPELVEEILASLSSGETRNAIQEAFLSKLKRYGGDPLRGYDHTTMAGWAAYRLSFVHQFFRIYDMNDPAVAVLRHSDFVDRFVPEDSVSFTVQLPDRVTGDINPRGDLVNWADELLAALASS